MKRLGWFYGLLFLIALGLIVFPAQAASGAAEGLRMCGTAVIPALLPFFLLTRLLLALLPPIRLGTRAEAAFERLFGVSGSCVPALLLSMLGGYPVGVSSVTELYESGAVTKQDAQRALRFCNNSGPAFFVGVVGANVLGSVRGGLVLYALHVFSALLVGAFFAEPTHTTTLRRMPPAARPTVAEAFQSAVGGACTALLHICTLVILFSVLLRLLDAAGFFRALSLLPLGLTAQEQRALASGVLELSNGVVRLGGSTHAFVLSAGFMGWGGLCVHLQAMSLWQPARLRPSGYFPAKLLHGLLSAVLAAAYAQKTAASTACAAALCAICLIFPRFRRKGGRNPRRLAV